VIVISNYMDRSIQLSIVSTGIHVLTKLCKVAVHDLRMCRVEIHPGASP